MEPGSINQFAQLFNRGTGVKCAEIFFKAEALMKHTLEGALTAYVILHIRKILANSTDTATRANNESFDGFDSFVPIKLRLSASQILQLAEEFLQSISPRDHIPLDDEPIIDGRVKFGIVLMRIARRFEFKAAIKAGDYFRILSHLKMALPDFIGGGYSNYALESVRFFAKIFADCSEFDASHLFFSLVINQEDVPNKPKDLVNEELNLAIKTFFGAVANLSTLDSQLEGLSQCVLLLKRIEQLMKEQLIVKSNSPSHTEPDVNEDLVKAANYCIAQKLVVLLEDHSNVEMIVIKPWVDAGRKGASAIELGYIENKIQSCVPILYSYKKGDVKPFHGPVRDGSDDDDVDDDGNDDGKDSGSEVDLGESIGEGGDAGGVEGGRSRASNSESGNRRSITPTSELSSGEGGKESRGDGVRKSNAKVAAVQQKIDSSASDGRSCNSQKSNDTEVTWRSAFSQGSRDRNKSAPVKPYDHYTIDDQFEFEGNTGFGEDDQSPGVHYGF